VPERQKDTKRERLEIVNVTFIKMRMVGRGGKLGKVRNVQGINVKGKSVPLQARGAQRVPES